MMSHRTPNYSKSPVDNSLSSAAPFIDDEWQGVGGGGGGYVTAEDKSDTGAKPQSSSRFAECFCGEKGHPAALPERVTAPPSEIIFKNGARALWADKHCPRSLSTFVCHAQQTQQLKQLISQGNCPHLLFQGPRGAGKKALAVAVLHDIFGDVKVLPEHRPFTVQGGQQPIITIPIVTSKYHVEVNVLHIGEFDKDVLPNIIKEVNLSTERAMNSPVISSHPDIGFKLILVLNAEKLSGDAQQILRLLMERYGDTCKLILCCNSNDAISREHVLCEGMRSRCQVINAEVPNREEIVKVLNQVAKREDVTLPKALAARIAEHCKDSLRKAIVQLEACKNYQYPLSFDQRLHISHWEEDVIQIVADVVADPTVNRFISSVRTKLQTLLNDCISPILILQKLLEEFLLQTDWQLKKQICDWAVTYEKRLRTGLQPMGQLEAFLAKVMSMYQTQAMSKPRLS